MEWKLGKPQEANEKTSGKLLYTECFIWTQIEEESLATYVPYVHGIIDKISQVWRMHNIL